MITASFSGLNSGAPPASVLRSWSTSIDATSLCINSHNCSIKHLDLMRTPYPRPQYITLPTLLLLMLQRTKEETEALAPLTSCLWHLKLTIRKMSPRMFSPASLLSSNKLCCSAKPRNGKNQRRHHLEAEEPSKNTRGLHMKIDTLPNLQQRRIKRQTI